MLGRTVFICGIRFWVFTQQQPESISIGDIIFHIFHLAKSICEMKTNILVVQKLKGARTNEHL